MLEEMLRSNTFKKAKEVTVLSCNRQPVPRLCSSVLFPDLVGLFQNQVRPQQLLVVATVGEYSHCKHFAPLPDSLKRFCCLQYENSDLY